MVASACGGATVVFEVVGEGGTMFNALYQVS
jgi:hypothetical protein